MAEGPERPVVLLFVHSLLGQGIAQYVLDRTGVAVIAVPVTDDGAVQAALAENPRVVIFERDGTTDERTLAERAPDAVLIDVTDSVRSAPVAVRRSAAPQAESILHAVVAR